MFIQINRINLLIRKEQQHGFVRDGFKTQPPVDRWFRPVPAGFYCSKQWQPPVTGRNCRSTGGWVLKPPVRLFLRTGSIMVANLRFLFAVAFNKISVLTTNLHKQLQTRSFRVGKINGIIGI